MEQTPLEVLLSRGGIRRLKTRDEGGNLVELEDHTRWEVQPGNELFTRYWSPQTQITVVPGELTDYAYDLINAATGDRVAARYKGRVDPDAGWSLVEEPAPAPRRRRRAGGVSRRRKPDDHADARD